MKLSRPLKRWIALPFAIGMFLSGIAAPIVGAVDDHEIDAIRALYQDHVDGDDPGGKTHLIRYRHAPPQQPCNACYFHKLLSCALLPSGDTADRLARTEPTVFIFHSYSERPHLQGESSRGPPSLL